MPLTIRAMTMADLDAAYVIEKMTNPSPWAKSTLENAIASTKNTTVIEFDGAVAGYAVVSCVVGEAELLNICIDPQYQGQGLGGQLLAYLIDQAQGQGNQDMYLEVRVSNLAARHLYEKAGFNEVGIRPNYYPAQQGREDAVLMALPLLL